MNHAVKILCILFIPLLILAVIFLVDIQLKSNSFNLAEYDSQRIQQDIEFLSSSEFAGKSCGSHENEMAMAYVKNIFEELGLMPVGDKGSYFQNFKTIVPDVDPISDFHINDDQGNLVRQFVMYEDFRVIASNRGKGINYSGDILLVGHNLYNIDPSEIKGRIVVVESLLLDDKKIDYTLEHHGLGVLFVTSKRWSNDPRTIQPTEKSLDLSDKKGSDLLIGSISQESYGFLKHRTGINSLFNKKNPKAVLHNAVFESDISFPPVSTANILGMLEGRSSSNRILMISASLDGLGRGAGTEYFPGAVNNTSGLAALLEIARVLSSQKNLPYKTIVFSVWNGEENNAAGARYYVNNPLFPLDKTTVIHLNSLGAKKGSWTQICSDSTYGGVLRSEILHISQDSGLPAGPFGISGTRSPLPFLNAKVPTVLLSSDEVCRKNYEDKAAAVDMQELETSTLVVLNYLKRSIYKDVRIDYLDRKDKSILWILLLFIALNHLIHSTFISYPNLQYREISIERLYFHPLGILLRKAIYYLLPVGLAIFLLVFIVHLPVDSSLRRINGETVSNFSSYISIKKSLLFIKDFLGSDLRTTANSRSLFEVIYSSTLSSLKLLSFSLFLSFVWGIGRGIYESWHEGKRGILRSAGTLISASVPDVIVVIAGLWLYVFVAQKIPAFNELINLKEFILPLLTLSLLPAAYVSRITSICIRDELSREYVRNARAKGFSKVQIYLYELVPPVLSRVLDSFSALSSLMLTNLIIVEYLFNYKGIIYYLLYFYKRHDGASFISLCLTVALLYLLITSVGRLGSLLINPLKRKRVL
jgi:ABC-type dipeptide/oligopeptide/nickel transport system permease component